MLGCVPSAWVNLSGGNGVLCCKEFVVALRRCDPEFPLEVAERLFWDADEDMNDELGFDNFVTLVKIPEAQLLTLLKTRNRCKRGLLVVEPNKEPYFGFNLGNQHSSLFRNFGAEAPRSPTAPSNFSIIKSQHLVMELYESRVASVQRFVSMTVMFHQMGHRVENFFEHISFGCLGYRIDRSHSMLRIATTASPISGSDVRERMETLRLMTSVNQAVATIQQQWAQYKHKKD
jgi:hypothetical protein